jgi:hypothetical protein
MKKNLKKEVGKTGKGGKTVKGEKKDRGKRGCEQVIISNEIRGAKKLPRLVSLFSGCGGLDKGFELAGFERVFANDFDKDAQRVFKKNLGDIDPRDIRTIPSSDIPTTIP